MTATEQSPVSAWQQVTDRLKSKYKYQKKKKKISWAYDMNLYVEYEGNDKGIPNSTRQAELRHLRSQRKTLQDVNCL